VGKRKPENAKKGRPEKFGRDLKNRKRRQKARKPPGAAGEGGASAKGKSGRRVFGQKSISGEEMFRGKRGKARLRNPGSGFKKAEGRGRSGMDVGGGA